MTMLEHVNGPEDLKELSQDQLGMLASEIRDVLVETARRHRLVAVVEDNGRSGGFGDAVCRLLRDADVDTPRVTFGLPQEFLDHGSREAILDAAGLSAQHLARQLTEAVARRTPGAGVPGTPGVPGAPDAASAAETASGPAAGAARVSEDPLPE